MFLISMQYYVYGYTFEKVKMPYKRVNWHKLKQFELGLCAVLRTKVCVFKNVKVLITEENGGSAFKKVFRPRPTQV